MDNSPCDDIYVSYNNSARRFFEKRFSVSGYSIEDLDGRASAHLTPPKCGGDIAPAMYMHSHHYDVGMNVAGAHIVVERRSNLVMFQSFKAKHVSSHKLQYKLLEVQEAGTIQNRGYQTSVLGITGCPRSKLVTARVGYVPHLLVPSRPLMDVAYDK